MICQVISECGLCQTRVHHAKASVVSPQPPFLVTNFIYLSGLLPWRDQLSCQIFFFGRHDMLYLTHGVELQTHLTRGFAHH